MNVNVEFRFLFWLKINVKRNTRLFNFKGVHMQAGTGKLREKRQREGYCFPSFSPFVSFLFDVCSPIEISFASQFLSLYEALDCWSAVIHLAATNFTVKVVDSCRTFFENIV